MIFFGDIVLKTADLCSAKDDCVRLKNALVNLGNSKELGRAGKNAPTPGNSMA